VADVALIFFAIFSAMLSRLSNGSFLPSMLNQSWFTISPYIFLLFVCVFRVPVSVSTHSQSTQLNFHTSLFRCTQFSIARAHLAGSSPSRADIGLGGADPNISCCIGTCRNRFFFLHFVCCQCYYDVSLEFVVCLVVLHIIVVVVVCCCTYNRTHIKTALSLNGRHSCTALSIP